MPWDALVVTFDSLPRKFTYSSASAGFLVCSSLFMHKRMASVVIVTTAFASAVLVDELKVMLFVTPPADSLTPVTYACEKPV